MNAFVKSFLHQIREINRRYATPEVEMTLFVRMCLIGLRVYLILMVALLIVMFIKTARQ